MSIDFLIVGGGIGGAVLANLLTRRGQRVVVLERSLTPAPQTRPEVLWPATVRVLRSLIPSHLEERWMLLIRAGQVYYKQQTLLHFNNDVFEKAGVHLCSTANTRDAVAVCTSSPRSKISISTSSPAACASTRSSICE